MSEQVFIAVTAAQDIEEKSFSTFEIDGTGVVICRFRDEYFAIENRCSHALATFDDVTERRDAEEELQLTLDELDERVQQRTQELMRANESLRREVEERVRLQAEERQQRSYAEALRDPHVRARESLQAVQAPEGVEVPLVAPVPRMSRTPPTK